MQLRVLTSGACALSLWRLRATYQSQTGTTVALAVGASMGDSPDTIARRLERGEAADAVFMLERQLRELEAAGRVAPASIVDVGEAVLAVGVRRGATAPDISSEAALRRTLLAAASIAVSESASGVYVRTQLLPGLGITDDVLPKVTTVTTELPGHTVARGAAELAFQQLSELLAVDQIEVAGELPDHLQLRTRVAAAVVAGSVRPSEAQAFIAFVTAPAQRDLLARGGVRPVDSTS